MCASPTPELRERLIQLPRTSTRQSRQVAFLKLLTAVREKHAFGIEFEGKILSPGGHIPAGQLPATAVLLECAGPIGPQPGAHNRRETVWILWRYDWEQSIWIELARASSLNWEWTLVLREPAIRALNAKPVLVDVLNQSRKLVGEIMHSIDVQLEAEVPDIQVNVLSSLYNQVAGRIAALA